MQNDGKGKVAIKIDDQCHLPKSIAKNKKTRSSQVTLWLSDALMLCLEHLQMFALILSISLRWPWPQGWIHGSSFLFFFNLDVWEFTKVQTVYAGQQQAFPNPSQVPFNYLGFSIIWALVVVLATVLCGLAYKIIPKILFFSPVYSLLLRARLIHLFALVAQALCLPFGLTVVRLFDCQNYPSGPNGEPVFQSVVLSNTECWSSAHLGILIPMLVIALAYFFVLPFWMIYAIKKEVRTPYICTSNSSITHEKLLRLKEAEFVEGLDTAWEIRHYSLFSSFVRPWVWFRPLSFFLKGLLLAVYGSLFYVPYYQTLLLFVLISLVTIVLGVIPGRVYRLLTFNIILILSIDVNLINLVLGLFLVSGLQNSLLTGDTLTYILTATNFFWLLAVVLWFCYLIIRSLPRVRKKYGPLWPTLAELNPSSRRKSENNLIYFQAILKSRQILEKCYSAPPLFAPVNLLSKQIQVVNVYCQEAEQIDDVAHDLLRALLPQLVDVYNHLYPLSVLKTDEIPTHIQHLTAMIPKFSKRLDQREYNLILSTPRKRRILLKLLAVATFLEISLKSQKGTSANWLRVAKDEFKDDCEGDIVRRKSSAMNPIFVIENQSYQQTTS